MKGDAILQQPAEIGQIILSVLLVVVILFQTKGSSFSGAMGGDSGSIYHTRRGLEKTLFQLTIALAVLFVVVAVFSAAVTA
ncbi:MAG: preprotein translocase subunit SecG [Chloroflexia bacterium]|nr:preprotein translocase subunit SecG [Chloroflexia bacterium]